jgi:hypothetical protein
VNKYTWLRENGSDESLMDSLTSAVFPHSWLGIACDNRPGSEKTEDEIEDFWETMSDCVSRFEQSEMIVCSLK